MTSTDSATPSGRDGSGKAVARIQRPTIFVKQLSSRARKRLLRHFLALDSGDRLLRFARARLLRWEESHA